MSSRPLWCNPDGMDETDSMRAARLSKEFIEKMKSRGVTSIDDEAVRYHLSLLLKAEHTAGRNER